MKGTDRGLEHPINKCLSKTNRTAERSSSGSPKEEPADVHDKAGRRFGDKDNQKDQQSRTSRRKQVKTGKRSLIRRSSPQKKAYQGRKEESHPARILVSRRSSHVNKRVDRRCCDQFEEGTTAELKGQQICATKQQTPERDALFNPTKTLFLGTQEY